MAPTSLSVSFVDPEKVERRRRDWISSLHVVGGTDDVLTSEQGFEVRCGIHAFDCVAHALDELDDVRQVFSNEDAGD